MAKEPEAPVTPVVPEPVAPVQPPAAEPINTESAEHMIPKSRLDEVLKAKEKAEKDLLKYQDAEKKRKDADLSDLEKANKRIVELEGETKQSSLRELRRKVGEAAKLPPEIYELLPDLPEEDMKVKAEALAKAIPQKSTVSGSPTNPGNAHLEETPEQKRERLLGPRNTNPFEKGGGVKYYGAKSGE
jgi:hypothetical protein